MEGQIPRKGAHQPGAPRPSPSPAGAAGGDPGVVPGGGDGTAAAPPLPPPSAARSPGRPRRAAGGTIPGGTASPSTPPGPGAAAAASAIAGAYRSSKKFKKEKKRRNGGHPAAAVLAAPPPRVVRRPPLNAYLRIAILRRDDDAVACEDPENPGATKAIALGELRRMEEENEADAAAALAAARDATHRQANDAVPRKRLGADRTIVRDAAVAIVTDPLSQLWLPPPKEGDGSRNKNKKEIPVPTITTVKRYDADVPPDYSVPPSYVRNVCPTYEEVQDAVEYNVDGEDERWWRESAEFGPFAKAKIMVGDREQGNETAELGKKSGDAVVKAVAALKEPVKYKKKEKKMRGKSGKFVKRIKPIVEEVKEKEEPVDATEADEDNSENDATNSAPAMTYTLEQVLTMNPRYLYSRLSTRQLIQWYNPKLPLHLLEKMMDALEKATGFESIVTWSQAEEMLVCKLPELEDIFGPLSEKDRRLDEEEEERHLARWIKSDPVEGRSSKSKLKELQLPLPTLGAPITLPGVIHRVYDHWVAKRSRLKKPLLRRYWPPTSATDTNPHQVFRQPSKEKRRLRKKKQNGVEAYQKMKQLRQDFERVKVLCDLIARREGVNKTLVELTNGYFEERLRSWIGPTVGDGGEGATPGKREVEEALDVPKYFDDGPIVKVKGNKKRKRSAHTAWTGGRDPSLVPPHAAHHGLPAPFPAVPPPFPGAAGFPGLHPPPNLPPGMQPPPSVLMGPLPPPRSIVVAGHDGGFPAPNFLQPLATRESHVVTSWEDAVPHIPSYVNGRPAFRTDKFRHRPRLGRGGRIIVDRVPCPANPYSSAGCPPFRRVPSPPTVVTYGGAVRCGYDVAVLGCDGPRYSLDASPGTPGPDIDASNIIEESTGTDAATAPKAPPANTAMDLLPKPLPLGGDPVALSRRLQEICAEALLEDSQEAAAMASSTGPTATPGATASAAAIGSAASPPAAAPLDEVLVPLEDWMEAPEALRVYGMERFVVGPL